MKSSNKKILYHLSFWLLYVAYNLLDDGWDMRDYIKLEYNPHMWTELLMSVILVYFNLFVLLPRLFYTKKYGRYALVLSVCLLAGGVYSRLLSWGFWIEWERVHDPANYVGEPRNFYIPIRIIRNALSYCPVVGLTMFLTLIDNAYEKLQRLRELEEERHQAEWDLLKAQVHPHFFFNTLNSLYALTMVKSDKGSEVVLQLSDLMHYVLYEANAPLVALETEIRHLENYIGIERLRFGDRLELHLHTPTDINGQQITPLLLLPFIENAFKHSLDQETETAWIRIDIRIENNGLYSRISNSYHPVIQRDRPKGIGLDNVKKRLDLCYPGSYRLSVDSGEDIFEVLLTIPLHEKD